MATGTNGIATIQDCIDMGLTCSGYTNATQCPTYGEFENTGGSSGSDSSDSLDVTVSISSALTYSSYSSSTGKCKVTNIATTLSEALPFAIKLTYTAYTGSSNTTKVVTVSAGTTTVNTSNPFGSYTYVMLYSITAKPTVDISSATYDITVSQTFTTK